MIRSKPYIDREQVNEDFHQDALFIESDRFEQEGWEYFQMVMELMEARKANLQTEDIEHEEISSELNNNSQNLPF
jgi:hypothetical protein